jgi:hypothetical protein
MTALSESSKDFLAGTTAGFAGKLLDYPFDTVKVLLQTQAGKTTPQYNGAWHCLHHTVKTKGFTSLYKGISSPLLGSMAENAVLFWAYNQCKRALGEDVQAGHQLSLWELALAGAGAGVVVPFVQTPFEVVKCRLQVQCSASTGFRQYKGPIDVIVQTIKTEGIINGLYRGHVSTMARDIPGNYLWYGIYEGVCMLMIPQGGTKADLGPSAHLLGGALSGIGYWTAFYPADTVKSLIQTNPDHVGKGFIETMLNVIKREGIRGLYRGWAVTAARAAPSHALIFAVYEYIMKLLSNQSPKDPSHSTRHVVVKRRDTLLV